MIDPVADTANDRPRSARRLGGHCEGMGLHVNDVGTCSRGQRGFVAGCSDDFVRAGDADAIGDHRALEDAFRREDLGDQMGRAWFHVCSERSGDAGEEDGTDRWACGERPLDGNRADAGGDECPTVLAGEAGEFRCLHPHRAENGEGGLAHSALSLRGIIRYHPAT